MISFVNWLSFLYLLTCIPYIAFLLHRFSVAPIEVKLWDLLFLPALFAYFVFYWVFYTFEHLWEKLKLTKFLNQTIWRSK